MDDRIITVVGGSGFLGRYVVKHLAQSGFRVRVLCRHPSKAFFLKPMGDVGQIAIDYADVGKPESLKGKLMGSYAVVNLVGILAESGRQKFSRIQAQGAEKLAQEAKIAGVTHFVQISALGVDKATGSKYAKSKLAGEDAVRAIYPNAVILRPSLIFGAEDNFFNQFAGLSRFLPFLPAIGGNKPHFQPVYVDDVAKAVVSAITQPNAQGKIYELGGPEVFSFMQLLRLVGVYSGFSRKLIPVPFALASFGAFFVQNIPGAPITADQVALLKYDNVLSGQMPGFAELGINPTPLEAIVPNYLAHYRNVA